MASISIPKLVHFLNPHFTRSFHLYAVIVDDHIIFHMHMLTYEISGLPRLCF